MILDQTDVQEHCENSFKRGVQEKGRVIISQTQGLAPFWSRGMDQLVPSCPTDYRLRGPLQHCHKLPQGGTVVMKEG